MNLIETNECSCSCLPLGLPGESAPFLSLSQANEMMSRLVNSRLCESRLLLGPSGFSPLVCLGEALVFIRSDRNRSATLPVLTLNVSLSTNF